MFLPVAGPWGLLETEGPLTNPTLDSQTQPVSSGGYAVVTGAVISTQSLADASGAHHGGSSTSSSQIQDVIEAPGGSGGEPSFSASGAATELYSLSVTQGPTGLYDGYYDLGATSTALTTTKGIGGVLTPAPVPMAIVAGGLNTGDILVNFNINLFLTSTGPLPAVGTKMLYLATGEILVTLNSAGPNGGSALNGLSVSKITSNGPTLLYNDPQYGFNVSGPFFNHNPPNPGNITFTVPSAGKTGDFIQIWNDTTTVTQPGGVPSVATSTAMYTSTWNLSESFVA